MKFLVLPLGLFLVLSNLAFAEVIKFNDGEGSTKNIFEALALKQSPVLISKMGDKLAAVLAMNLLISKEAHLDRGIVIEQVTEISTIVYESLICTRTRKLMVGENASLTSVLDHQHIQNSTNVFHGSWSGANNTVIGDFYNCSLH